MFAHETFGVTGPFGAGGGLAVDCTGYDSLSGGALGSTPNAGGTFDVATFSFEMIVNGANTGNIIQNGMVIYDSALNRYRCGMQFNRGINGLRGIASPSDTFSLGGLSAGGAWAHGAITYDGAQWIGYNNGVANTPVAGHAPTLTVVNKPLWVMGDGTSVQGTNAKVAAAAYFSGVLSAAQVAAHQAAIATSSAAYKTAVLADSPLAFWMLDSTYNTAARTTALAVQNGAVTVAVFPTDVPVTSPGTFTYSWQTLGPGALQSVDGTLITVPIPTMQLPPGYTVGSNTADIVATDQWSNITLWYDDGTGTPGASGGEVPYLDALLVPQGWPGGNP
jgi:hypothetical protein